MRLGPFWWLEPIEYGFHKSQSTQRPSRPPQTRIIVRSRATCCRSARAVPGQDGAHTGEDTGLDQVAPDGMRGRRTIGHVSGLSSGQLLIRALRDEGMSAVKRALPVSVARDPAKPRAASQRQAHKTAPLTKRRN